ncbi:hornerin, partial [Biomphalaria glabrata]
VTIFQECQPEFLHDLVLKMKAYIFTPGDLICRRGEVAREMFIIADGVVEIISETGVMLKRMGAGDFFGEIGILNLDGGINRRTADVRSVGYLELFVLSREDVLEALKDHPEAESIIRDYGQRRLREVEAHRQRVKPLKCRGSTDQQGSFSNGSQTVQNRLLQTLRSLNPAVRRQSAQIINHISGSPPASTTTGNGPPSGNQRCVAQPCLKDSRVSRDCTPTSASPLAQVHTPVVLVDQPPADPAPIRAPARRRRSLGYLRTACVRFKHAFNRRRGRRRSLDDDGHRVQNQYMTKSLDDQSRHSDQSGNSSPLPQKCNIKLNIETCQDASRAGGDTSVDNSIEDNEIVTFKHVQEKMSIFGGIKRGSSLMQAYFEGESSHFGPKLTKGTHRKYSEPVAYMPVCTEDTDEPQSHPLQESDAEGEAPVTNALPAPYSLTVNNDEEASMTPALAEQSNPLDLSATSSGYLASSHALSFTPQSRSSCSKSEENSSSLAASIQNEALGNYPVILSPSANIEAADAQPTSQDESFKSSFSIKSLPTRHSPTYVKSKNSSNTKHSPARIRKLINSSNPRVLSQSETQAENKVEAPLSVPASPVPCFKKASPSPFSLSCHCDPAENFSKFISKHLPDSFRQRLMKTNAYLAVQSPRLNNKYRTSSDSDAPENQKTLSPCGNHLALRSQSFPRLNDAEPPTSRTVQ